MLIRAHFRRALLAMVLGGSAAFLVGAGADTLSVGSSDPRVGAGVVVPVEVLKENAVVAVQFRLRYPAGLVTSGAPLVLSDSSDHEVVSTDDAEGERGVVVFSKTNSELPVDFSLGLPLVLGDGTPTGGPSVSVEAIIFTDGAGSQIGAATEYTLVETWRRANFSPEDLNVAEVVGDDADPDGDGVENLAELGGGLDPNASDARGQGEIDFELGGDGKVYVTMKFWRSSDAAVRAAVPRFGETSVDLETWAREGVVSEATGATDAAGEEVEVKAEVLAGDVRRFLRVVTRRAAGQ